jgi:hypothetical protein
VRLNFTGPEPVELGCFIGLTMGQQRFLKTLGLRHGELDGDSLAGLAPDVAAALGRTASHRRAARDRSSRRSTGAGHGRTASAGETNIRSGATQAITVDGTKTCISRRLLALCPRQGPITQR